jgi:hypothetical protein
MNTFYRLVRFGVVVAALAVIAALLPIQLQAQTTNGSIVGAVTDSTGAVVPGATVNVTNIATGEAKTVKSDSSGSFSIVNLLPANYKIDVQKTNFKHYVRQPIQLEVGATVRLDIALQVGAASETVEVTTQTPLLQTDSSSVSQEIEGQTVTEMPLNGRNSMNLIALAAGVVPQGSTQGSTGANQGAGHTMIVGWGNYQIGGTLAGQSAMYVDGAPVNVMGGNFTGGNITSLVPTQDAVQEFNVASSNVSAEFGRYGGGVINMATKGGTNSIHGSVYEYLRNTDLNANDWFNKLDQLEAGLPNKPLKWIQNQYGVAVGGPIKKNKLFYHFNWEGFHATTAQVNTTFVPTGNVDSATSGGVQNGVFPDAITDPLGNCNISTTANPGYYTITNLWSAGCGDPLAKLMRQYYPAPNLTGSSQGNYYAAPPTPDKQNQYGGRIDYAMSNKQRIFGRYTYWALADQGFSEFNNHDGWITQNAYSANLTQQLVLGDTYTFSPSTVLDVRLSFLRDNDQSSTPGSLGMSYSVFPSNSYLNTVGSTFPVHELPIMNFNGPGINYYAFNRVNSVQDDYYNTYAIGASLIRIIGRHSLKFGADLRRMEDNNAPEGTSGQFAFGGNFTGDKYADFLLGYEAGGNNPGASSLNIQAGVAAYNYYQAYYVNDTWQTSRRLTLNLGLRWELPGGIYTRHNWNDVLLPTTTDPFYGTEGTLAVVGSSLFASRSSLDVKHNLFSPHVGFAYRLGNNNTVRGGYTIAYLPNDSSTGSFPENGSLISQYSYCGPAQNATVPVASQLLYNCFGTSNPIIQPAMFSANWPQNVTSNVLGALGLYNNLHGRGISGPVPNQKFPYAEQWNLAVSHQFKGNLMLDLSYVGAAEIHAPASSSQLDQIPDGSYNSSGVVLSGTYAGQSLTAQGNCWGAASNPQLEVGQCLRPYPHVAGVSDSLAFNTQTIYHGLQFKGEKRFGAGGVLMGNFTWAKMIGNTDSGHSMLEDGTQGANSGGGGAGSIQDYQNLGRSGGERVPTSYDVPYRAVFSYVLSLPFGKGQRWLPDANGVVAHLVSGWGLNGITTFQHGFHIPMQDGTINNGPGKNNDLSSFGVGSLRPNFTAGCSKASTYKGNARIAGWFNNSNKVTSNGNVMSQGCWSQPADFTFGSEPRVDRSLFAQGIDNFDFAALKSTAVTERINVQFRAELFNIFNRKQFAQPDSRLGSNTFGQILGDDNQPRLVQFSLRVNF